ncbi:MAG TPA: MATE family efflux transporter [Lachnospiraceae bacterium]|nr:MATE family efflux transporter [uncultured Lachnoclostridium sp.]HAU88480.1 MATE family efflux transporter [Lachnospiraceae bacterium]
MNTVDMTKGSPVKLLIQFSIPILIGNLFQQVYTLADRIIVGRFVGDKAFSAIGATNALSMLFMSMCMGAAIGTGVVVSQYFGAKDEKGTAASIANGSYTCILIAIVMTLLALVTTKPILILLNTPQSILPDALTYMYIFMGGLIAVAAYYTPFSILRALGDSKTPLIFLVVCSLLNIVLDLLFVVVFRTGVAGAAVATVLSEAIAAILCIIYAFQKVPQFRQAFIYRKIDKELIKKTLQVGVPTGLQYALIYVSSIILQRIVNGFGESVIGAFTATTQIELLVQQIFAALGAAIVTYTGQNMGAGKQERISLGVIAALKISAVVSVVLLILFWLFGHPIMSIFVTNADIISIATTGIRITSLFLLALGGVQILRYMLNGAGDSMYALINGVVEVIARVVFAVSLTAIPFIGMWGIWLTTGLTWAVTAVFALFRYKHGAWKGKTLV